MATILISIMPDNDFPSGPWTGFYQYKNGRRGQQDLRLAFENGRMTGTGADELGQFIIEGSYKAETKEAKWLKSYPGAHNNDYRGFREGPVPGIWGTWSIAPNWHGGFHIWPLGDENSEIEMSEVELLAPRVKTRKLAPMNARLNDDCG